MTKWEIVCGRYGDDTILKEEGPLGRFLFKLKSFPGLKGDGQKFRDMISAAPILFDACRKAYDILEAQMDDAEKLDHAFNGHEADNCPLCVLRKAIEEVEW